MKTVALATETPASEIARDWTTANHELRAHLVPWHFLQRCPATPSREPRSALPSQAAHPGLGRGRVVARDRSLTPSTLGLLRLETLRSASSACRGCAFLIGLLLIGQLTVRPLYSTTFSDLMFLAALVTMLGGLLLSERMHSGSAPRSHCWFGVVRHRRMPVGLFERYGWCLDRHHRAIPLPGVDLGLGRNDPSSKHQRCHIGVALWVVSLTASGAAAIAQFMLGDVIPDTDTAFGRMTGTAQHVNDLGGSAAVALTSALGLTLMRSVGRPARLIGAVGTVLITSGLILSGSIGGMIAAMVGVGVAAAVTRRSARSALWQS